MRSKINKVKSLVLKKFTVFKRYQVISFVSGFSLLAYELAGSRILAPVVGSSTYVWTSIIGVIIAALSIGYFIGGWLADKRKNNLDIMVLLVGSAIGILSTLVLSDFMLVFTDNLTFDVRLKSFMIALVLFAPTSILLGALSPYLAKMHTKDLEHTGKSIATLSALNSIGGITGTFLVGFVFFGYVGLRETLLFLTGLLLFCSLLLLPKDIRKSQIKSVAIILVVGFVSLFIRYTSPVVANIDTPTSSYLVRDITYNKQPVRVLTMGPGGYQSGVFTNGNKDLVFDYTKAIAQGVALHGNPKDILVLGGGVFTLPEYLANKYPNTKIDVVEIDDKLKIIAEKYFSYSNPDNVVIYTEDARTYMNKNEKDYDVIIIDAFSDTSMPFSLTTSEFTEKVASSLKPKGVTLSNIIAANNDQCKQLLGSVYGSYTRFMKGTIFATKHPSLSERQNLIAAFSKSNDEFLSRFGNSSIDNFDAVKLTDNFAPIERLHQQCPG